MDSNVLTAAISAGAAVVTAIVALLVNSRGFGLLSDRLNDQARQAAEFRTETNAHFARIEADLKDFFKVQAEHDKRLGRIEDKLGIPPR